MRYLSATSAGHKNAPAAPERQRVRETEERHISDGPLGLGPVSADLDMAIQMDTRGSRYSSAPPRAAQGGSFNCTKRYGAE